MKKKRKKRPGTKRRRAIGESKWSRFHADLAGHGDIGILRPHDPELSKRETQRIQSEEASGKLTPEEASKQFDAILAKQPGFTFVGMMTDDPEVVLDPRTRKQIPGAKVLPWDSFVPMSEIAEKLKIVRPS